LGQLVRERTPIGLIGFTTYTGTVTPPQVGALHETTRPSRRRKAGKRCFPGGVPQFLLTFAGDGLSAEFNAERLERAIGVIYRPETERLSHYFHARIWEQFDAVLHFDESSAVEPLPHAEEQQTPEVPETYPMGV
jgi:erythromycin esterase-like protein